MPDLSEQNVLTVDEGLSSINLSLGYEKFWKRMAGVNFSPNVASSILKNSLDDKRFMEELVDATPGEFSALLEIQSYYLQNQTFDMTVDEVFEKTTSIAPKDGTAKIWKYVARLFPALEGVLCEDTRVNFWHSLHKSFDLLGESAVCRIAESIRIPDSFANLLCEKEHWVALASSISAGHVYLIENEANGYYHDLVPETELKAQLALARNSHVPVEARVKAFMLLDEAGIIIV